MDQRDQHDQHGADVEQKFEAGGGAFARWRPWCLCCAMRQENRRPDKPRSLSTQAGSRCSCGVIEAEAEPLRAPASLLLLEGEAFRDGPHRRPGGFGQVRVLHDLALDQRRFVLQPLAQRLQFGDELIDLLHCVAGQPLQ
jgi:hypothetical protein